MNTNDVLHVALTSPENGAFWSVENVREFAETAALFFAAVFFCSKFVQGYFFINLSLEVECERKRSSNHQIDFLLIRTRLEKGDRGSLRIHDAKARISILSDKPETKLASFPAFERQSFVTDQQGKLDRKLIDWSKTSEKSPILRIAPGEKTESACVVEVPRDAVCSVEVAIQGRRGLPTFERLQRIGQWKAATVSLPLEN